MSYAANAYAKAAQSMASPREIEAQALLKAASKLQDVVDHWDGSRNNLNEALLFNRKLWSILLSDAISDQNPHSIEIRQKVANIGTFVMNRTLELQLDPRLESVKPLIDINRNIAAGLCGNG